MIHRAISIFHDCHCPILHSRSPPVPFRREYLEGCTSSSPRMGHVTRKRNTIFTKPTKKGSVDRKTLQNESKCRKKRIFNSTEPLKVLPVYLPEEPFAKKPIFLLRIFKISFVKKFELHTKPSRVRYKINIFKGLLRNPWGFHMKL